MVLIDRLKADKLIKTTNSIELFHTFTTLQAKKCALTLLHRYLYSLYVRTYVSLYWKFEEIRKVQFIDTKKHFIAVNKVKM